MVIFAVTKSGFKELESIIKSGKYPVWIGGGVLTKAEIDSVRYLDVEVTNFSYPIDPNNDELLDDALATIAEHHPNERVWLECQP